jgi:hypothetical protein
MGEAPRLKPMLSTEILDAAFRLYRSNFATFLGIFAVIYVPITLVVVVFSSYLYAEAQNVFQHAVEAEARAAAETNLNLVHGLVQVVQLFLYALIEMPLATGALTCAVGMRYLNEPASIGRAYRRILPIFFKYLGTTMLSGLVIGLTFLGFLLPGIFLVVSGNMIAGSLALVAGAPLSMVFGYRFMTWFFATASVVCIERLGGTAAMGRSRFLVKGFGWRVFGLLFLVGLLQGTMMMPISMSGQFILPRLTESMALQFTISTLAEQALAMVITPYFSAVLVLLYYDLRIRKEAYDLELLATNMGSALPPQAAPSPP